MKKTQSTSYGIIPCFLEDRQWKVFLVQHVKSCFWGFPKGHPEEGEVPKETAEREMFEETGLELIRILKQEPLLEEYVFQDGDALVEKKVFFYIATTTIKSTLDHKEILDGKWLSLEEAKKQVSYKEGLKLLEEVETFLKTL